MNSRKIFILVFILFISSNIYAQKNKKYKKLIAKKWKLSEFTIPEIEEENLSNEEKEKLDKFIEEASFEFKEDGTYEMTMMGNTSKGTWQVDQEGKTLIIQNEHGYNQTKLIIIELNKNTMTITDDEEIETSMTLVPAN